MVAHALRKMAKSRSEEKSLHLDGEAAVIRISYNGSYRFMELPLLATAISSCPRLAVQACNR